MSFLHISRSKCLTIYNFIINSQNERKVKPPLAPFPENRFMDIGFVCIDFLQLAEYFLHPECDGTDLQEFGHPQARGYVRVQYIQQRIQKTCGFIRRL